MRFRRFLPVCMLALPALAADVSVNVDVSERGVGVDVVVYDDLSARRAAFETARISLADAIQAAQKEMRGQAIEAELDVHKGAPVFEIELLSERREIEVKVDAVSGRILDVDADDEIDDDDVPLRRVKTNLTQAIERAAQEVNGRAYEAELEMHDGRPEFEVDLFVGPEVARVVLDADTGKVLSIERYGPAAAGWHFDATEPGNLPTGWIIRHTHEAKAPATWDVVEDEHAATPPHVLKLTKTVNSGSTYNLLVAGQPRVRDVDLHVKVRADTGEEDQGGGPVWRYRDENNYYICRLNPLEGNYRVYKVENGKRTQLDSADVEAEPHRWYELRAVMIGNRIACYLDGKQLLNVRDDTFTEPGSIGLWTKADAATSFDNVLLLAPKPSATAPARVP